MGHPSLAPGAHYGKHLEGHPSRHLEQARIVQVGCDVAELGIADHAIWTAELDPVEQVEGFYPQLQREILMDRSVLVQSKVIIRNARRAQLIILPRFVPISKDGRSRVA